ncbi:hypothetical protein BDR05DRAFT_952839 [Suillus weaverae]|nr:hypothetical protein BDR05DRAFT_952839 [Suillus weaverae]
MDPSFQFRHWSTSDVGILMKSKGTIKDIDGDYSFMISGKHSQSCSVAAHYRLPLRAINKKFGLYRKVVNHLTESSHPLATQLRDTYLSVMDYLQNVRIAFWADARGSPDPLDAGFRSPAMDYYLWLDHRAGGFHHECRMNLEKDHHITLKSIKNRECTDIIPLLDWASYHANTCREYDICGAFQGAVYEENIQHLLDAVDSSMDAGIKVQNSPSLEVSRDVDTGKQPISEVDVMDNINLSVVSVHGNLNAVSSPAESAPMALANTTNGDHTVDQSITIPDTLSLGQHAELIQSVKSIGDCNGPDGAVDPPESAEHLESVLRPFPHPFERSYCKQAISTMGAQSLCIDLSQWFIAYIVVRMRELHGLDEDAPLDHALTVGSENKLTYEEYCELHGMSIFLSAVQMIAVERQSIAQFFQYAAHGLRMAGVRVDCAIQCDADSLRESGDTVKISSEDGGFQNSNDGPYKKCDDVNDDLSTLNGHDKGSLEAFTLDVEKPCMTPGDWTVMALQSTGSQSDRLTPDSSTQNDIVNDTSCADHVDLRGRLRPRKLKESKPRVTFAKPRRRGNSPSEHHDVVNQQGSVRPIIFAVSETRTGTKRRKALPAVHYTLDDLIKETRKDHKDIPPFIHSFLIDPHRDAFIESKIPTEYHLLVDVARFVAASLSKKSLSNTLMLPALSLMKIEYWLQDIANDCKKAVEADDIALSPLARHGLIELSKRASTDAASLSEALGIYMSKHQNSFKAFSIVTRYLCNLRVSRPGADIEYESGFKVLAKIIAAQKRDTQI